jgi:hypothetical protein
MGEQLGIQVADGSWWSVGQHAETLDNEKPETFRERIRVLRLEIKRLKLLEKAAELRRAQDSPSTNEEIERDG